MTASGRRPPGATADEGRIDAAAPARATGGPPEAAGTAVARSPEAATPSASGSGPAPTWRTAEREAGGGSRTILLLAGEASGDLYGAALARTLRERLGHPRLLGTGGPLMAREGVELLEGLEGLSVMGLTEVLPRLGTLVRLERRVTALLRGGEIDLVVPIDFAGLNLRVARKARERGVPVLYYVAPKFWAWGGGRARRLARVADHVATILPFEVEPLRAVGARATYVGHPLLDRGADVATRERFCAAWRLDPGRRLLAVLPGSRPQEIARHLETFAEAAGSLAERHPDLTPVLARAPGVADATLRPAGLPVVDDARALLRHAAAAIVKSGTGTLEATLEGIPFVIAYRTSALTWAVARRVLRVDHIGLPNLVAGLEVVPELVQEAATPERIAQALAPLLDPHGAARARMVEELARVRSRLGTPGAAARVADLAVELLERRAGRTSRA